jgi:hypothetical protein
MPAFVQAVCNSSCNSWRSFCSVQPVGGCAIFTGMFVSEEESRQKFQCEYPYKYGFFVLVEKSEKSTSKT